MKYRMNKKGEPISILGYGCMRFTKKGTGIDLDKAEQELMTAFRAGVNYYDTAYVYSGSEVALGTILERNGIRDQVQIATKLPQYLLRKPEQIDQYFNEELSRLRTDYIDYYLMHMMTDYAQWENLERLGIREWAEKQKAAGRIRNIGFSFHGNTDMFLKILNAYDWDFCQIQYNYLDEVSQAGREGLEAAEAKGIPVIIMEPLRGGRLVNLLPEKAKSLISSNPHGWSPAEWSFRWLWNQTGVTCVLSGMNSIPMVEENCRIASEVEPNTFTKDEFAFLETVKEAINEKIKIGCTGCRYCMPCPKGVDIPGIFRCWNEMYTEKKSSARFEYAQTIGLRREPGFATQCVRCGKCEKVCPQNLPIRDALVQADRAVRPLPYKIGINIARKLLVRKTK